jgi:hypothetical protein
VDNLQKMNWSCEPCHSLVCFLNLQFKIHLELEFLPKMKIVPFYLFWYPKNFGNFLSSRRLVFPFYKLYHEVKILKFKTELGRPTSQHIAHCQARRSASPSHPHAPSSPTCPAPPPPCRRIEHRGECRLHVTPPPPP